MRPLDDILVLDFSQFLSGPSASLRLADLGARVIKVERPGTGDICRHLYTSNVVLNGESSVFHAINRNKESITADLKDPVDCELIRQLIARADVMIHNFRPGVMKRIGLDYDKVKEINPSIVYGEISGYGDEGPWKTKPGQDLLLQSLTGITWLNGNADDGPVPMGLSVVDMLAGVHLVQGLLACLVRQGVTGEGALVQVSMIESAYDLQFETITTWYRDGGHLPERTARNNAHAYLGAPYGIYPTADGYLSLAMGLIPRLGELLGCVQLTSFTDPAQAFDERDNIKEILANHLQTASTQHWLDILEPADIWCSDVLDWDRLMAHEGFKALDMLQEVKMTDGFAYFTTRCPIRIDGEVLFSPIGSPKLGEHNDAVFSELVAIRNDQK